MASSHSMYKHQSKIAKATPIQKANSKLQLQINRNINLIVKLNNKISWYKKQLTIDARFNDYLKREYPDIYNKIVSKQKAVEKE